MKALKPLLFVVFMAAAFVVGFAGRDLVNGQLPRADTFGRIVPVKTHGMTPTEHFRKNFDLILAKNMRQVDSQDLKYAAMEGAVASLGDPHTNFFNPEFNKQFTLDIKGDFVGIGARLGDDPLGAKVGVVFANTPASRAGLKVDDVITKVNGKDVRGVTVDAIVEKIKGVEGTPVELTVVRGGKLVELRAVRAKVTIPTVSEKLVDKDIAYVSVTGFSTQTAQQFREAMSAMLAQDPKGLIIDLRGNGGGLLNAAVEMLSLFVSDKPVVSIKSGDGHVERAKTPAGGAVSLKVPVTILVNGESASASEIFAGALRDYKKAVLVGTHTYGKASVQDLYQLSEGASLKVTIAKYFLPQTPDISRKQDEDGTYVSGGLKPDFEVELDISKDTRFGEAGKDSQLDKAIAYIRSLQSAP